MSNAKGKLGKQVYRILSEGGDEEEMARKIAEAYTQCRDFIGVYEKKIEREKNRQK